MILVQVHRRLEVCIGILFLPNAHPFSPSANRPQRNVARNGSFAAPASIASMPVLNGTSTGILPWNDTLVTEEIMDLQAFVGEQVASHQYHCDQKAVDSICIQSEGSKSFHQYNIVNNFADISERLLHRTELSSCAYRISKSSSFLAQLSKAHHSTNINIHNAGQRLSCRLAHSTILKVKQSPTTRLLNSAKKWGIPARHQKDVILEKSLTSYDVFNWHHGNEVRSESVDCGRVDLQLIGEIDVKKPGYLTMMQMNKRLDQDESKSEESELDHDTRLAGEQLWVSGFSLSSQRGEIHALDVSTGDISTVSDSTAAALKWPNELTPVPKDMCTHHQSSQLEDALLVADGFLVPGKENGGLWLLKHPGTVNEQKICLTAAENPAEDWFYHKAIWIDLTGDGRRSILSARARKPMFGDSQGQLVWLECPLPQAHDEDTGDHLDTVGNEFDLFSEANAPWKLRVLAEGPDVMFLVADLDSNDDTLEIISSQFFSKKVSLHSIKIGLQPRVVYDRIIDENCGHSFSSVLADLDGLTSETKSLPHVVDNGSTVDTLSKGDAFSHLLVTSHECSYARSSVSHRDGGSLFAYRIPLGKEHAWKTEPWKRSTIATGFKVQGHIKNIINPGAPGFCYTFYPTRDGKKTCRRPLIALSGDCAESAYILRPIDGDKSLRGTVQEGTNRSSTDKSTKYALCHEIQCQSTVGSLAIGYDDLYSDQQQPGYSNKRNQGRYAKIYVPCYEDDKVLVFAMIHEEKEQ